MPFQILFFLFTLQIIVKSQPQYVGASSECTSIPFNLATKCNLTCESCGASRNVCSSCQDNMVLSGSGCVSAPNRTLFYSQFFMEPYIRNDSLGFDRFSTGYGGLSPTEHYAQICMAGIYRWEVIGLFNTEDRILYKNSYFFAISQVSLSFRLFTTRDVNTLHILVNKRKRLQHKIDTGSQRSANLTVDRQIIIEQDLSGSINNLMIPIRTGFLLSDDSVNVQVQIYVSTNVSSNQSESLYFWGFSEFNIVAKQCNICVSDAIKQLASTLGLAIGITFAILIVLVVILCILVKWRDSQAKRKRREKFKKVKKSEKFIPG